MPTDCGRITEGLLKDCRRMLIDADGRRRMPTAENRRMNLLYKQFGTSK